MRFSDMLIDDGINHTVVIKENVSLFQEHNEIINEKETQKPEEVLRGAGFKIKMVTPTSFGTQIDLAKAYEEDEIKGLLKDFEIKVRGKSIFVVD